MRSVIEDDLARKVADRLYMSLEEQRSRCEEIYKDHGIRVLEWYEGLLSEVQSTTTSSEYDLRQRVYEANQLIVATVCVSTPKQVFGEE
ncbi:MAG: hypothetical protein U9R75_09620 [Candidatus Thermoplasmatota archaeon]|nr:hypothetical protein [Candidatus Thermoplasmatota archaeon]